VSLLDRIIDSLHSLFYSQKRSVSVGSRFIAVAAVFFTVTTVFPTLAEELLPPAEVVQTSNPLASDESAQNPVEEQSEQPNTESETPATPAPLSDEEKAKAEEERIAEEEKKAEEARIKPTSSQPQIKFRFPQSIALDPRASVANLPQLSMSGGSVGLLCLSSNGVIDVSTKGSSNNFVVAPPVAKSEDKESSAENAAAVQANRNALQIAGDLTSFVRVSGTLNQINELINSAGGLRITASQGRVINSNLVASYVELTGSDLSPAFCSKASNQQSIAFRALGLQMDTVKTRVDFNKPSGK
jgi:type IV secretory pathway VirB10-like protein